MSKADFHKIQIRSIEGHEKRAAHGITTEVLLDGQKLRGITGLRYEVGAAGLAKISIEMLGTVDHSQLFDSDAISINVLKSDD